MWRVASDAPPLCKGRGTTKWWRDCEKQNMDTKQSLSRLRRQLPLHKGAYHILRVHADKSQLGVPILIYRRVGHAARVILSEAPPRFRRRFAWRGFAVRLRAYALRSE